MAAIWSSRDTDPPFFCPSQTAHQQIGTFESLLWWMCIGGGGEGERERERDETVRGETALRQALVP